MYWHGVSWTKKVISQGPGYAPKGLNYLSGKIALIEKQKSL